MILFPAQEAGIETKHALTSDLYSSQCLNSLSSPVLNLQTEVVKAGLNLK
jgi:hypothetical protein